MDDAITMIKSSHKLKDALMMIVEIGNYMNRKQAPGIKLSSLQKLAFVKSSKDKNVSFLHVVERFLRVKCKATYGFVDELSKVLDLGNLVVGQVEQDFQEYLKRIDAVKQSLDCGRLSDSESFHPEDRLLIKVGPKMAGAARKATLLQNQFKLTMRALENLMRLYGEDHKSVDCRNDFFHHFIQFIIQFKKAAKENIENEEVERIYNHRKELLQQKTKASSKNDASSEEEEDDAVDILIQRLRDVNKSSKSSTKRAPHQNTQDQLLTRTQHMLDSIQKI